MSTNDQLRVLFEQLAAGLQLLGADSFRSSAHARVAREIGGLGEDVADFVARNPSTAARRLAALPGIGAGSAKRILEYVENGSVEEHRKLLEKVPVGLFELLAIPGLGPKAVQGLWRELGITSLAKLEAALGSPELESLPRMGKKSVENIRRSIAFSRQAQDRVAIGKARPIAERLVAELARAAGVDRIDYAGSLRRGRETIGDIDLLVACDDPEAVAEHFTGLPEVKQVLGRGLSKSSVRLEVDRVAIQADLRIVPAAAYGAALLYFTGSKDHNVRLREIAIERERHLNEYGLFEGTEDRPQDRGETPVAAATEEAIYEALGLPYIPPELREDRGELEPGRVPEDLIEIGDVRSELHAHTDASDGRLSLEELVEAARSRRFHTLAITDHSQSAVIAGGLSPDRLRAHVERIRELDERTPGITLLAGAEVDILPDGSLDYDDELLAELDIVVASPHVSLRQSSEVATERLLRAIRHPLVHIIGHPTGRVVTKREGLEPDLDALFRAAAECDTVLEINAHPRRLDLRDQHVRQALEHGCRIAVDTDVHSHRHFDYLIYGILTARRAGLPRSACINTWPAGKLHRWLAAKRQRVGA